MLAPPATSSDEVTQPAIFRRDYNRCVDCRRETLLSFTFEPRSMRGDVSLVAACVDTQHELRDVRARAELRVGRLQAGLEKVGKWSRGEPSVDDHPVALRSRPAVRATDPSKVVFECHSDARFAHSRS
jgi:hypothetical protein